MVTSSSDWANRASAAPTAAVLLMAHGAARTPDDLPRYYTHIRGGSPPPEPLLAELRRRYAAIGGASPLDELTRSLAGRLQSALESADLAVAAPIRVWVGYKHVPPFIEESVSAMAAAPPDIVVGLALAPHYSRWAIEGYRQPAAEALARHLPAAELRMVPNWHREPGFLDLWAGRLKAAWEAIPVAERSRTRILFTAHSLPERVVAGDPYPSQLAESAHAIAKRLGLPATTYRLAWQSAGRTADRWLGPDILQVLEEEAAAGTRAVVVCPQGFVSDHLEILYDLDIEAARRAAALGLRLVRAAMPNDDPSLAAALANVVRAALTPAAGGES